MRQPSPSPTKRVLVLLALIGCAERQGTDATGAQVTQAELVSAEGAERAAGPTAANGTFTASRACSLFQSKRDRTNPGNLQTSVGAEYAIRESQMGRDGSWYRVQTTATKSPLRWVSADCGTTGGEPSEGDVCHLASHQDSNVLALSWQPAFCADHEDKTECEQATSERYDASHFTLHGLWPNQRECDQHYGYCGRVHNTPQDFCTYPEVSLMAETRERLGQVMPSVAYGTCLERHEWWKHGACWGDDPDAYFREALRLAQFINESSVVSETLGPAIGKTLEATELRRAIDVAFGASAASKFELACNNRHELVEVRVSLPASIKPDETLRTILQRAPDAAPGCTGRLRIVAYGH